MHFLVLYHAFLRSVFVHLWCPVRVAVYEGERDGKSRRSELVSSTERMVRLQARIEQNVYTVFCGTGAHDYLIHIVNYCLLLFRAIRLLPIFHIACNQFHALALAQKTADFEWR